MEEKAFVMSFQEAFSKLTASSGHDHKKIAFPVLNRPRNEQNHIDESKKGNKNQVGWIVLDVRRR